MTDSDVKILWTASEAEYAQAVATSTLHVPVIRDPADPAPGGFGDSKWLDYAQWAEQTPQASSSPTRVPPSPDRLCVALGSGVSESAARLVAERTGRSWLRARSASELEAWLRQPGAAATRRSLTWFCPAFDGHRGGANPSLLREVLAFMRSLAERGVAVPWGIITGINAAALTRLAAKAILQHRITESYRARSALVVNFFDPPALKSPIPPYELGARPDQPLLRVDEASLQPGHASQIVRESWSLISFKAHGRSYCAARGFLCAARTPGERLDAAPKQCVLGMQCLSSRFPQIDPRRFDTPLLVLDACGSGNLATRVWETGQPSIAYLAAAGAPSAIVTGDTVTMNQAGDFVDILWSLQSASTLGEAVQRLNSVRREPDGAVKLTYFLLGDPEIGAGLERFPEFAHRAAAVDAARPGGQRAPYLEVRKNDDAPSSGSDGALHLWTEDPKSRVVGERLFRFDNTSTVWFGWSEGPSRAPVPDVFVQRAARLELPHGLLEAACDMPRRTLAWTPPLQASGRSLVESADKVIRVGRLVEHSKGAVVTNRPQDVALAVRVAQQGWLQAHIACIKAMLALADGGIWPFRFWSAQDFTRRELACACKYCGVTPSLERRYRSYPTDFRLQRECLDCDLIDDRPEGYGFPNVNFDV
ncbi:MAG TPA: hypothetical protein VFQ61_18935, partial [Polyangiaceae bacterium]|nr:hypothetical protein [Polyangiaceae bacterium]